MSKNRTPLAMVGLAVFLAIAPVATPQDPAMSSAPAFNGGVFVTPVAGSPFSAEAEQLMVQVLRDGSSFQRKTAALIARDSQGRIRNERHEVLPASSNRKPIIYSVHIYDPDTRLSTFLNPYTHVASQWILPNPPSTEPPSNRWTHLVGSSASNPNFQVQALGASVMDGIDVEGFRKTVTLPAKVSGTDRPVVVTDEIWYSQQLHVNILSKHDDPRTGSLTLTVSEINVNEPDVEWFAIPPEYKLVDLTPPSQPSEGPVRVVQ